MALCHDKQYQCTHPVGEDTNMKGNRSSHRDERVINGTGNTIHGEPQGPATHGSRRTETEDNHFEGLNNAAPGIT